MSEIARLAQRVVMRGIHGPELDSAAPICSNYLLFPAPRASLAEVRATTDALRERHGDAPVSIAIDQEGGAVMRLCDGIEPMPSMMALGAAGDVNLAQRAGEQMAFDLRRAGCTLDFAPVLDLALEAQNVVIGTRSFGADPQRVAALGDAVAEGMRRGGVLPCFKHFPGHGSTSIDSHAALPVVEVGEATLRRRDLVPFASVAPRASAMMSAHVLVRAFDAQRPATLSRRVAVDLLRKELGFRGALVTDCLEMGALASLGPVAAAAEALDAGADLLLFSHRAELAADALAAIEAAVARGRLSVARLEEAQSRAGALARASLPPLPLDAFPPHPGIGREIARRAVTLVRGLPHADPLASIAISFGGERHLLEREAPALREMTLSAAPAPDEISALLHVVEDGGRRPILLVRRAHRYPAQAAAVATILDRFPDALVISVLEPFDLPLFENARHLMATCGDGVASIGGLADVLFGTTMPTGRLPV